MYSVRSSSLETGFYIIFSDYNTGKNASDWKFRTFLQENSLLAQHDKTHTAVNKHSEATVQLHDHYLWLNADIGTIHPNLGIRNKQVRQLRGKKPCQEPTPYRHVIKKRASIFHNRLNF